MTSMHQDAVAAGWISSRIAGNPNFDIPTKPVFPAEFRLVPCEGGIVIVGSADVQFFGGRAAGMLLPRLTAALDGSCTVADIAARLPDVPQQHIEQAIALLYTRGLLEEGHVPCLPLSPLSSFVGRFVDYTRANRSRREIISRLQSATVGISAPPASFDRLAVLLLESGIGTVTGIDRASVPYDWVVVVEVPTFEISQAQYERICHVPALLYAFIGGDETSLGPLCTIGRSPCYVCYRTFYRSQSRKPASEWQINYFEAAIVNEITALVGRYGAPSLLNRIRRIQPSQLGRSMVDVTPRVPACEVCGSAGATIAPGDEAFDAWAFHDSTIMPPKMFYTPKSYQEHYRPANIALANVEQKRVPDILAQDVLSYEADQVIDWSSLATMVSLAAGYQRDEAGVLRRNTPSGGNLGSPSLYVLLRSSAGDEYAIFRHVVPSGRYQRIGTCSRDQVLRTLSVTGGGAPAYVVGVAVLDKVFAKYRSFGYRVVHLDAGFALSSLVIAAMHVGVPATINIRLDDEAISEVLRTRARSGREIGTFAVALWELEGTSPWRQQPLGSILRTSGVVNGRWRAPVSPLDLPNLSVSDIFRAMAGRRSIRSFSRMGVTQAHIVSALEAAQWGRMQATGYRSEPLSRAIAIVARGTDLGPGGYELKNSHLVKTPLDYDESLSEFLQQEDLARAAATIVYTADLERAFENAQPQGYREALISAGFQAFTTMLAIRAKGAVSCPSGGFFVEALRQQLALDGYRDCPLFTVAIGMP
jgi:nitroreductase